jgi:hypothetical protein
MLHFLFYLLTFAWPFTANQSTGPIVVARPCAAGWDSTEKRIKKKRPKSAKDVPQNKKTACMELAVPPLEIQEYLKS